MSAPGYIYVLINPSMEGLVKVGKTARDPNERAKELSSVTGVPTPFIVVYKAYFDDCTEVENFLHQKLQTKGHRVSNNREFFNAPIDEIITYVVEAQSIFESKRNQPVEIESEAPDYDSIEESNDNPLLGLADYYNEIDQYREAFKLYEEALDKGSHEAYYMLGSLLLDGKGCFKNEEKAAEYFKKGAQYGDGRCYIKLAFYFVDKDENHSEDSSMWFQKYLNSDLSPHQMHFSKSVLIFRYFVRLNIYGVSIDNIITEYKNEISNFKKDIVDGILRANDINSLDDKLQPIYLDVARKIDELC